MHLVAQPVSASATGAGAARPAVTKAARISRVLNCMLALRGDGERQALF